MAYTRKMKTIGVYAAVFAAGAVAAFGAGWMASSQSGSDVTITQLAATSSLSGTIELTTAPENSEEATVYAYTPRAGTLRQGVHTMAHMHTTRTRIATSSHALVFSRRSPLGGWLPLGLLSSGQFALVQEGADDAEVIANGFRNPYYPQHIGTSSVMYGQPKSGVTASAWQARKWRVTAFNRETGQRKTLVNGLHPLAISPQHVLYTSNDGIRQYTLAKGESTQKLTVATATQPLGRPNDFDYDNNANQLAVANVVRPRSIAVYDTDLQQSIPGDSEANTFSFGPHGLSSVYNPQFSPEGRALVVLVQSVESPTTFYLTKVDMSGRGNHVRLLRLQGVNESQTLVSDWHR